jgi:bacterioferritin-associated ferredoxin
MSYYLILCRSLTYAQRAVRTLVGAGITAVVARAPQIMLDSGCGYCARISEKSLEAALAVLKKVGIRPDRVLRQGPDGSFREVAL